jgi:hypothetical protein
MSHDSSNPTYWTHHGRHELVAAARSEDPTQTKTVRQRYAQKLRGGYSRINTLVREFVGKQDVLGLGELTAANPPPDFSFSRNDQKIEGFRRWLDQAQEDEVLDVVSRNGNRYVRQAYETGTRSANTDLRKAGLGEPESDIGITLQMPVHQDTLQTLYTRNFSELQGLTDEIGREISRELTQALGEGTGPREAGRRITDIIGTVDDGTPRGAMARATTIARTEILNARHMAAAEQYERFGVKKVEPILAPNACDLCIAVAADAPYTVDKMRSILPRHPNCRCSWTIYTGGDEVTASAHVRRVPAEAIGRTVA